MSLNQAVIGHENSEETVLAVIPMTKTITNDLRSPLPSRDNAPKPQFPERPIPSPNKCPPIKVRRREKGILR